MKLSGEAQWPLTAVAILFIGAGVCVSVTGRHMRSASLRTHSASLPL